MEFVKKLRNYLKKVISENFLLTKLPEADYAGLPLFYRDAYSFYRLQWLNQIILLAISTAEDGLSPSEYTKQVDFLKKHLNRPVVVVLPYLESYKRTRLIQYGVPFIVPDQQLFIPPFADLRERFSKRPLNKKNHLSAAAQLVLIHHLFKKDTNIYQLNELAKILGYSAMTLTTVRVEFIKAGLCISVDNERNRYIGFTTTGKELWKKAMPLLISPIAKTIWAKWKLGENNLPRTGISALASYTMINDDQQQSFACRNTLLKELLQNGMLIEVQDKENADCRIESWKYSPDILSDKGNVDRLSLYLSMKDSPDERVQAGLDRILENMLW